MAGAGADAGAAAAAGDDAGAVAGADVVAGAGAAAGSLAAGEFAVVPAPVSALLEVDFLHAPLSRSNNRMLST